MHEPDRAASRRPLRSAHVRRRVPPWRALGVLLVGLAWGLSSVGPVDAQGSPFAAPPAAGTSTDSTPPLAPPGPSAPPPTASSAALGAVSPGAAGTAPSLRASLAPDLARLAEAVNSIRAQNGRPPLHLQAQLTLAAQRHADGMAQSRTMSHVGPFGARPSDRMGAAGYDTCGGGENVSFGALESADDIARGWYDSPGHRAIMLDDTIREMGVGRGQTPDGVSYWALEVGQRPTVAPIVINGEAAASPVSDVIVYVYPQVSDYCLGPARNITQVTLSNSPDFAYAQTFDYAPSLPWTLAPGEGQRTVYARLMDSSGRTLDAQDDILVSATAQPASTASDLTPAVQTVNVAGPGGTTQQMTIYRSTFIAPPNAAVTTTPCPGTLTGCLSMSSVSGAAGAPVSPAAPPAILPGSPGPGSSGYGSSAFGPAPSPLAPSVAPVGPLTAPAGNCPLARSC